MPLTWSKLERDASVDIIKPVTPLRSPSESMVLFKTGETVTHATCITEELQSFGPPVLRIEEPLSEDQPRLSRVPQNGKSRRIELSVPALEGLTKADPILTDRIRRLVKVLWAIVISRALQVGFPLLRTTVSIFDDPTEQESKAVLRLICNANATQAIAFWDSLEPDLQDWLGTLSETDRTTFVTKLSLRVHWH